MSALNILMSAGLERAMVLSEVKLGYPKHKGIKTAVKAWVQCQACYVWFGVKILHHGKESIHHPGAHTIHS